MALEVLHHHVGRAVLERADVGDLRDVLAFQLCGRLRLAHEPFDRIGIERHVLPQHLDREALVELEVGDLRDDPHPPLAEDRLDPVLAQKDLADADRVRRFWSLGQGVKMVACPTLWLNLSALERV